MGISKQVRATGFITPCHGLALTQTLPTPLPANPYPPTYPLSTFAAPLSTKVAKGGGVDVGGRSGVDRSVGRSGGKGNNLKIKKKSIL